MQVTQASVVPELITEYEPCFNDVLRDVEKRGSKDCRRGLGKSTSGALPLQVSAMEIEELENDETPWAQGVDLIDDFINKTACPEYGTSKARLAKGVKRLLSCDEERAGAKGIAQSICLLWIRHRADRGTTGYFYISGS
ncbi:hypothetical protein CPSG_03222 [Coccidioides posadasii str. Silveira]|uniref:Uncharacterized protein n=2 Tax=Coccidioides posadasii TaxID=199306 RepID=E9D143_COCPS|nr:hypothetical protein CPSG_03222 [Coccidioides posadasii str. Silveira]KMM73384.1 hypothetical protein CPAG_09673 [Coccidioides posadasii RMSCC 3488]